MRARGSRVVGAVVAAAGRKRAGSRVIGTCLLLRALTSVLVGWLARRASRVLDAGGGGGGGRDTARLVFRTGAACFSAVGACTGGGPARRASADRGPSTSAGRRWGRRRAATCARVSVRPSKPRRPVSPCLRRSRTRVAARTLVNVAAGTSGAASTRCSATSAAASRAPATDSRSRGFVWAALLAAWPLSLQQQRVARLEGHAEDPNLLTSDTVSNTRAAVGIEATECGHLRCA